MIIGTAAPETVQKSEVNEDPEVSYNTDKSANLGEVASQDENNMESEVLEDDSTTQPYVADRNFESESETIPVMDGNVEGKFDRNPLCKDYNIEATPGYCIKDLDDENDEHEKNQDSEDSTTANSQPLPIGPNVVASHKDDDDDVAVTLAYGREATQAYVTGKDDNTDTENDGKKVNMQPNDLQATQAYGIQGSGDNMDDDDDDEKEERTEKESRKEEIHEQFEVPAARNGIDRGDTIQATTSYNLEALQAYGGHESDETDDKDAIDKDKGSEEVNKVYKDRTSVTCGLPETLHNGEDDKGGVDLDINKDNTRADHSFLKPPERRKINAKLECALEETQAYNGDSIDTGMLTANFIHLFNIRFY